MWLIADEVWVSFISFEVLFESKNRNKTTTLPRFYLQGVYYLIESPRSLPKIRFQVAFPNA